MRKDQISDFVQEILATGAPIWAVGQDVYVICEAEVTPDRVDEVVEEIHCICERYGRREHLRRDIVAHLRGMGRFHDIDEHSDVSAP